MLPELRRASQQLGPGISVGTVDCTVHAVLCRSMGVSSYPTTRLYNASRVENFSGEHKAESIIEFLEDLMSPSGEKINHFFFLRFLNRYLKIICIYMSMVKYSYIDYIF